MEYNNFVNYFRDITVCKVVHNWQSIEMLSAFHKGDQLSKHAFLVYIDRPTKLYISIIQPDKRSSCNKNKVHTDIGLIVLQVNPKRYKIVEDFQFLEVIWANIKRNNTCEV